MTYELRKKYNQELLNHSFLDSPWIAGHKDLSVYDSINPKELPSSGDNFPNFSRWYRYIAFGNYYYQWPTFLRWLKVYHL